MNPIATARQLFKWLNLPWLPEVDAFIAEHSETDAFGSFGTYRRLGSRIASWINNTVWNDVQHMQQVCDNVLKSYGYLKIHKYDLQFSSNNNQTNRLNDDSHGHQGNINVTRTFSTNSSFNANYMF